jgi:hypothetical protein
MASSYAMVQFDAVACNIRHVMHLCHGLASAMAQKKLTWQLKMPWHTFLSWHKALPWFKNKAHGRWMATKNAMAHFLVMA